MIAESEDELAWEKCISEKRKQLLRDRIIFSRNKENYWLSNGQ